MTVSPHLCRSPKQLLGFVLLLCVGLGSIPYDAAAQRGQRKEQYSIRVFMEQGTCLYEIEDYPDQDLFRITPSTTSPSDRGRIAFRAEGTHARVEVHRSEDGTDGVRGDRDIKLRDGNPPKHMIARTGMNRSTEHTVEIRCCSDFGFLFFGGCRDEQEARSREDAFGALEAPRWNPFAFGAVVPRGPQALAIGMLEGLQPPIPEPLRPGGPVMKVDED